MQIFKFYSNSCGPCKVQGDNLKMFSTTHPDVEIVEVDVEKEENEELFDKYKIRTIPTLKVVSDDTVLKSFVGLTVNSTLEDWYNEYQTTITT
jgi:thiol-disulfide isomerase/thioredoxin